jgi:hypothetical protein
VSRAALVVGASALAWGALVWGVAGCQKRHPAARTDPPVAGYATVEVLGQGVIDAVNSKTLFRVRHLFPSPALYTRYFRCDKTPIAGMGQYNAEGLHGVMRHRTQHGKVTLKTVRADQPLTKKKGQRLGTCRFAEDVPHKLLTVTYGYRAAATPPTPSMDRPPVKPRLVPRMGSWSFVTVQLAGRWYLFIILAMDGKPIDEIDLPARPPARPPPRPRP